MSKELIDKNAMAVLNQTSLELYPTLIEDEYPLTNYTKCPLSRLAALGTAFEPIASGVQKVVGNSGTSSGLFRVTIPNGTHLAEYKSGVGNLGTVLNANNQIAGQAVLNPLVCNPTMIFMAAALASIDKKLDSIQELQQEMMEFLEQKERAELRGNLVFLADVLKNFRFNWDNETYKSSNHIKVLDIRQTAEQKILFYREHISSKLNKKSFIHSDKDVQKQIDAIQSAFKEYQLSLYTHGFSSFLDVMLSGSYASEYLNGIKQKIESYSLQYRELYTKCYDQLEAYYGSTIQSTLLKGIKSASKATGEAIAKIPVLKKRSVDETLLEAGTKLDLMVEKRSMQQLQRLATRHSSCVRPFVEMIETVDKLNSNPINLVFNNETVYIGIANEDL